MDLLRFPSIPFWFKYNLKGFKFNATTIEAVAYIAQLLSSESSLTCYNSCEMRYMRAESWEKYLTDPSASDLMRALGLKSEA